MNVAIKHSMVPVMSAAGILPTMTIGEAIHIAISKSNRTYKELSSSTGISATRIKEFVHNKSSSPTPKEMRILREKLPDLNHLHPESAAPSRLASHASFAPGLSSESMAPSVTFEVITPAMAKAYLAKMTKNRSVDHHRVTKYSRDMAEGFWRVTHQGIAFDTAGELIDGQHRLLAIIKVGLHQTMSVARNVPPEAMSTIDRGKARTLGNVLEITRNIEKGGPIESILRILAFAYDQTSGYETGGGDSSLRLYDAHEEGINFATKVFTEKEHQNAAVRAAFALAWPAAKDEVKALALSAGKNSLDPVEGAAILLLKLGPKPKGTAKERHNVFLKVLGILKEWTTGATTGTAPNVKAEEGHFGWWLDLRKAKGVD